MSTTSSPTSSWADRVSRYGVLLLALTLVGGLYTAFWAPQGEATEQQPASSQSMAVKEGRDLYLQGCSTCHGLNLQGGAGGPSLIGVGAAAVVFQVESGRMPLAAGHGPGPPQDGRSTRSPRWTSSPPTSRRAAAARSCRRAA